MCIVCPHLHVTGNPILATMYSFWYEFKWCALYFILIFLYAIETDSHQKLSFCQAKIIGSMKGSPKKRRGHVDSDKMAILNAWRRINRQTREALRRSFLPELVEGYEVHCNIWSLCYALNPECFSNSGDYFLICFPSLMPLSIYHIQDSANNIIVLGNRIFI